MTEEVRKRQSGFMRRLARVLTLWIGLPLFLLFGVSLASVYLFCIFRPELVTSGMQEQLTRLTGLPWRIEGEVTPVLAPDLSIEATGVFILAASTDQSDFIDADRPLIKVAKLRVGIEPSSLLSFPFAPKFQFIELESPSVHLAYDAQKRPLWQPLDTQDGSSFFSLPFLFTLSEPPSESHRSEVTPHAIAANATGNAPLAPTEPPLSESALLRDVPEEYAQTEPDALRSFAAELISLRNSDFPPLKIHDGSLHSYTDTGDILLSFTAIEGELDPKAPTDNLMLSAVFTLPEADLEVTFSLQSEIGTSGLAASGKLTAEVAMTPPGSRTVKGSLATSLLWRENGKDLLLPDFRMVAETDGLTARLEADLSKFSCTGPVQLHKLSLPRWFGFARSLPPGLQQPMDALIGEFDLFLDTSAAEARNLRGAVGPLAVSGYVGVQDYSDPVVVVDLDLDRANLDLLFPFLAAVGKYVPEPITPKFDHLQLAPYPKDPSAPPHVPQEGDIHITYDVKVRVAQPRVHDVDAGPLEVLVYPVDVKGVGKTRVAFNKVAVIQGDIDGRLDIDEHSIMMHYSVSGLELGKLPENKENLVRIAGKLTGVCDIDVPMNADGSLKEIWQIGVNASISGCDITGHYPNSPWRLFFTKAKASGKGTIFSVLTKGVRIEGLWDIAGEGIKTSWNPNGKDNLAGSFKGGLFWPPIKEAERTYSRRERRSMERRGVERISGDLALNGSLVSPLGSIRVPVRGKLKTRLNWLIYSEKISLDEITFEGFGSYCEGGISIDFSGKEVVYQSDTAIKLNPRELLKSWGMLPPEGFLAPRLLTGKFSVTAKSNTVLFNKMKLEADGAPISGEIYWKNLEPKSAGSGLWTFRLAAEHLNLDNFYPPPPKGQGPVIPSQEPWKLTGLKGLAIDAQLHIYQGRYREFSFSKTKVTATLQRDRFSLHADLGSFYGGASTLLFQGTVVPEKSQITLRKGLIHMQKVALGKALFDFTKTRQYAGTAELMVDMSGVLTCNADIPAKLNGIWNVDIVDGLYPAFLSNESSNLRNTFSQASANGVIEKGVIISDNFKLSGPMVDMSGKGWLNMNNSELDMTVSVTFAKVPTVPVRFYGRSSAPQMSVQGVNMVVETMQAAGMGIFSLVRNIFELPAHAVRGIDSLVKKNDSKKK